MEVLQKAWVRRQASDDEHALCTETMIFQRWTASIVSGVSWRNMLLIDIGCSLIDLVKEIGYDAACKKYEEVMDAAEQERLRD